MLTIRNRAVIRLPRSRIDTTMLSRCAPLFLASLVGAAKHAHDQTIDGWIGFEPAVRSAFHE
jgi:hypothetical protein